MKFNSVALFAASVLATSVFGREVIAERGMLRVADGHLKKRAFGNFGGRGASAQKGTTSKAGTASTKAVAGTTTSASVSATVSASAAASTGNQAATSSSDPQSSLTLLTSQVASGLELDGQQTPAANQVSSATSSNNFINFCATRSDLPLTNGAQVKTGSCNAVPMGVIVAQTNMPSSKFTFPANGATIAADQTFTITMAINNLVTGNFVNAEANFFSAPQNTNSAGLVIGHSHVVVEAIDSLGSTTTTNPTEFAFFKGFNDAAVGGILSATVDSGLPAGTYRMASINSAANHQPVLVSVAQHGSLDDMVYFTVSANGGASTSTTSSAAAGSGGKAEASSSASAAASSSVTSTSLAAKGVNGKTVATSSSVTSTTTAAKGGNTAGATSSSAAATKSAEASSSTGKKTGNGQGQTGGKGSATSKLLKKRLEGMGEFEGIMLE